LTSTWWTAGSARYKPFDRQTGTDLLDIVRLILDSTARPVGGNDITTDDVDLVSELLLAGCARN